MTHNERNPFIQLAQTPPSGLFSAILERIEWEKRRLARIRIAVFGFATTVSAFALFPVMQYAGAEFIRSGFSEYVALFFSDSSMVLIYWKEFALLLVESLPLFGLVLLGVTTLVFLGSLRLIAVDLRTALFMPRFA